MLCLPVAEAVLSNRLPADTADFTEAAAVAVAEVEADSDLDTESDTDSEGGEDATWTDIGPAGGIKPRDVLTSGCSFVSWELVSRSK